MTIERKHPVPLYRQIADELRAKIQSGQYAPGVCIPSEVEFMNTYGVGRITVRQAINLLAREGRLITKQGKGTFVTGERIEQELVTLASITEVLMAKGVEPRVKVLCSRLTAGPANVRKELKLRDDEDVLEMKRLYLVHDAPLCIIHYYLPSRFAGIAQPLTDENLPRETSYSVFEKAGIRVGEAHNIIRAIEADGETAKCLNVPVSSPVLCLQRTTLSKKGTPLEYLIFYYRADEFEFSVRLYRPSGRSRRLSAHSRDFPDSLDIIQEGHAITSTETTLPATESDGKRDGETRASTIKT